MTIPAFARADALLGREGSPSSHRRCRLMQQSGVLRLLVGDAFMRAPDPRVSPPCLAAE